jgi:hypothetical protein
MSSFCFVSFAQSGHCDFGGMSYLRIALALKERGHEVWWVVSKNIVRDQHDRVLSLLRAKGLVALDQEWLLTPAGTVSEIRRSIAAFTEHLVDTRCHVAVIDRYCTAAQIAAQRRGIPWAAVGTDGVPRTLVRLPGSDMPCVTHGAWNDPPARQRWAAVGGDEAGIECSYWCASPFLNISFMPRGFNLVPSAPIHAHAHAVGAGTYPSLTGERRYVLVTFGNTFHQSYLDGLLSVLPQLIARFQKTPFLVLTGDDALSGRCRDRLGAYANVRVETWLDYAAAFASARVAIGHGGSAFAWHALVTGTPVLAIPTGIGDQSFNCERIRSLALGQVVTARLRQPILRWRQRHADFDVDKLTRALDRLLAPHGSKSPLYHAIRSGGGVSAAASLLETLAQTRSPVTTCASGACCC